ncbi:MAG TPA: hypothetical protein V6C86_23455 [Oculatellaceae cyanobacterium]
MLVRTPWLRPRAIVLVSLVVVGACIFCGVQSGAQLSSQLSSACQLWFNHARIDDQKIIVERGVAALRDRCPTKIIRGMIDSKYDLPDFERASLLLAPFGNSGAEFILGWLCESGRCHRPNTACLIDPVFKQINASALGLTEEQELAAQWYALASQNGSSAASFALGNLLENSYGGNHGQSPMLAVEFYKKAFAQGDLKGKISIAWCHAYGRGVKANPTLAWHELEQVIKTGDKENSIAAIATLIQAWKDEKLAPSDGFSQGAKNAYQFARRYEPRMTTQELDNLYVDPGCIPDPNPQFRRDLATKIRQDLLQHATF